MLGGLLPQHEYCTTQADYTIIPWDFKAMAALLEVDEMPRINVGLDTTPMPEITPEMQKSLNIVYGGDYRIWDLIT
jgi:hypothetical protein